LAQLPVMVLISIFQGTKKILVVQVGFFYIKIISEIRIWVVNV